MGYKVYCIAGPTGSGKTDLSISLAKKVNGCVLNADASQFRKDLNIGTAKITKEEMQGIDHYMIDIIDANQDFSIYDFQKMGREILNRELEKRNVIVVGGSGLYINALLFDYDLSSEKREIDDSKYINMNNDELYSLLKSIDPVLAAKTHPNNRNRVERYLELVTSESTPKKEPVLLYDAYFYCINRDREELYDRINKRVLVMMENGWVEEVKSLIKNGVQLDKIKEIGYKEINDYLENKLSYDDLIQIISQKTRNYAKRQMTWFRHKLDCAFITNLEEIIK